MHCQPHHWSLRTAALMDKLITWTIGLSRNFS
jgi:hypothetical protein